MHEEIDEDVEEKVSPDELERRRRIEWKKNEEERKARLIELKMTLTKRFGNLVRAWKYLDRDRNGKLSFTEFAKICIDLNYRGNIKQLYKSFDINNTGTVTFEEFAPEYYSVFKEFFAYVKWKSEDDRILSGWHKIFGVKKGKCLMWFLSTRWTCVLILQRRLPYAIIYQSFNQLFNQSNKEVVSRMPVFVETNQIFLSSS